MGPWNDLVHVILGVTLCVLCGVFAIGAKLRSRRLTLAGLAVGIAELPILLGEFVIGGDRSPALETVAGVLGVIAGIVTIIFAGRAKAAQKIDGGTGIITPHYVLVLGILGCVLSVWMLIVALRHVVER